MEIVQVVITAALSLLQILHPPYTLATFFDNLSAQQTIYFLALIRFEEVKMFKYISTLFLVFGLLACSSSDSDKENPPPVADPDQFKALQQVIESDLQENNAVAVSVAIYHQGKIVYAEAFGEKVKDSGEPVTPNTLFQLGSTTKMHTGLATLQLIQQGQLNLEDKLVHILPDIQYPDEQMSGWQDVNIQHLLTHQGGFRDTYVGADADSSLVEYMTLTYPQQNPQMNRPGIFYNYSNPNWSYLGAVIEHLSQTPYVEHMKQSVFAPLGMQRTTLGRSQVVVDGDYALGFQSIGEEEMLLEDISQIAETPSILPAGSETWSTPTEQLKMAEFLLNGNSNILTDQLRSEITKPQVDIEFAGLPQNYGYGIYTDEGFMHDDQWYPEKVWHHAGGTYAHTSLFWILPEKDIAVSIMSSGYANDFEASMIAALNSVIDLPAPVEVPFAPSVSGEYEKHEGTYIADSLTIIVNQENDGLTISMPELDANDIPYENTLYPVGDTTFAAAIDNEELLLTFLPESEGGESVYLRHRNLVGIKVGY